MYGLTTYAIRYYARGHGDPEGWVVDGKGNVITWDSRKQAKRAMQDVVRDALPGEWYEIQVYDEC